MSAELKAATPGPGAAFRDDLLQGAEEIAEFLGWPIRTVYYVADRGHLPGTFRVGRKLCALKSEIAAGLRARAAGEASEKHQARRA